MKINLKSEKKNWRGLNNINEDHLSYKKSIIAMMLCISHMSSEIYDFFSAHTQKKCRHTILKKGSNQRTNVFSIL